MKSLLPLRGKRIGVFGKGGSGKSTVTVLLAKALRSMNYEICVLDADSTNMGFHAAFGVTKAPAPLIDFLGGCVFSGGFVSCPVDDPTPLKSAAISIRRLPTEYIGQSGDGLYLLTAGKIGGRGPGAGCDGPVAKIARDLRVKNGQDALITLIDFKAGLEDSARGALTSLDWALVVVDPTSASVQVAVELKETVEGIRRGELPATAHLSPPLKKLANQIYRVSRIKNVFTVLNKISDRHTKDLLIQRLGQAGISPIGIIYQDRKISSAWLEGDPIESSEASLTDVIKVLEREGKQCQQQS
jgi:CO dehydrogenase nickel-insertion accessory protein CooC1